jgi:hypothetical protein
MSAMTSLDWPVIRAILWRLSLALGMVAWVMIVILAWRQPDPKWEAPQNRPELTDPWVR